MQEQLSATRSERAEQEDAHGKNNEQVHNFKASPVRTPTQTPVPPTRTGDNFDSSVFNRALLHSNQPRPTSSMFRPIPQEYFKLSGSYSSTSAGRNASKVHYPDFKEGDDFVDWLTGFETSCAHAGVPTSGRLHLLEPRLPAYFRSATKIHCSTGRKVDRQDYDTMRASVMAGPPPTRMSPRPPSFMNGLNLKCV